MQRDLDRLEHQAVISGVKSNKSKCWDRVAPSMSINWERSGWGAVLQGRIWGAGWQQAHRSQKCVPRQLRGQTASWGASNAAKPDSQKT